MDWKCAAISWITTVILFTLSECRQMCFTCQYTVTSTKEGYECIDEPKNITRGVYADRCQHKCIIESRLNLDTEEAISYFRGCGFGFAENVCNVVGNYEMCYYTCEENFCNGIDLGFLKEKDEEENGSSVNAYSVMTVCAGFIFYVSTLIS